MRITHLKARLWRWRGLIALGAVLTAIPSSHAASGLLAPDLGNLWNGLWVNEVPARGRSDTTLDSRLQQELDAHLIRFLQQDAIQRERQLARISVALRNPTAGDYPQLPLTLQRAQQAHASVIPDYTRLHTEALATDQERAAALAAITIGRRGEHLLEDDVLSQLTDYVRTYEPWLSGGAIDERALQLLDRRVDEFIFHYHNSDILERQRTHNVWAAVYELDETGTSTDSDAAGLNVSHALEARKFRVWKELDEGLYNPRFRERQTVSPNVSAILRKSSPHYIDHIARRRWFEENEAAMGLAHVIMSWQASIYDILHFHPDTLEPLDGMENRQILERRRNLLSRYFTTYQEVQDEVLAEIRRERNALSEREQVQLLVEFKRMQARR